MGGRRRLKEAEEFLRRREPYCVSACARFIHLARFSDHLWGVNAGAISALLLHSKRSIFPVFNNSITDVNSFSPIGRFLRKHRIHAFQGLQADVRVLEGVMAEAGKQTTDCIDYDLMALDRQPSLETLRSGPPGLSVRTPSVRELEEILPLQEVYEQEEVLPQGAVFNALACRVNLEHILSGERILVAELGGRIVAKANTSAVSFTRTQIGGVFVHPDYRGRHIARRLCAELSRPLIASGWGINLFVKKHNQSAQAAYRSVGFTPIADYRITYY
jgi:predicted GNAT family acetyltransferase